MGVEIVTKEDLASFRKLLLDDLRQMLLEVGQMKEQSVEGYRTKDVRKVLGCSVNKLMSLRVSKKIRVKKVGGTLYYNKEDVRRLVEMF